MAGLGSVVSGGAGVLGSLAGILGNDKAEAAQLEAIRNATGNVKQGYSSAIGVNQPIYDQGLKSLGSLTDKYNAGGFSNPTSTPYQATKFDPSQLQNDPQFKSLMKAGSDSILGSAEAKGGLFSGTTDKALQDYAIRTGGEQEGRLAAENLAENQQGAQNAQTAFSNNANSNATSFNQGSSLAANANRGAESLGSLYTGQGSDLGNLELGRGNVRAGTILSDTGLIQGGIQGAGNTLGGFLNTSGDSGSNGTGLGPLAGGGEGMSPELLKLLAGIA